MILDDPSRPRHTIPRWHSINRAIESGELGKALPTRRNAFGTKTQNGRIQFGEVNFAERKRRWLQTRKLADAEDFLIPSFMISRLDDKDSIGAARELLDSDLTFGEIKNLAKLVSDGATTEQLKALPTDVLEVRTMLGARRRLIELNPRDSLLLTETALLYTGLGQTDASEALIMRALALTPNNRYVLRSAARFFTHVGKTEQATHALRRSRRTLADPWLLSAFLATQAMENSKIDGWKPAKNLLDNAAFSERDRSELGAEVGTQELSGGSRKKAIRFFRQSISDPTENTVAQVESVGRRSQILVPEEFILNLSLSYEATANTEFRRENWSASFNACKRWQIIEPFSSRPARFGATIAALNPQYLDEGIEIGLHGLQANRGDRGLLNNLSVLYAYKGSIADAKNFAKLAASRKTRNEQDDVIATATFGLVAFREGNLEEGAKLYIKAIKRAVELKLPNLALRAYGFSTLEIARFDRALAKQMLDHIEDGIKKLEKSRILVDKDLEIVISRIKKSLPTETTQISIEPLEIEVDIDDEEWSIRLLN